jgi:hypothetical protein
MQKVYLLLRSNKQTGPYSLEELLQLNLKPFDLVWVDGRSAAWQYPFEIPSLKPYVPETPHADVPFKPIATEAMEGKVSESQIAIPENETHSKRVFVSVPKTYTEHKAYMPPAGQSFFEEKEEVKQVIPSYSQPTPSYTHQKPVEEDAVHTKYSKTLNDVEEDYTRWRYSQKTKKKSSMHPKDFVLAALILTVIGGGYYIVSRPSVVNSVLPANKVATQTIQQPVENNPDGPESKKILSPNEKTVSNTNRIATVNVPSKQTKNIKTKNPLTVSKNKTNSSVPPIQNSMPVEKTNSNIHDSNTDIVSKEPEIKQLPKENVPTEKKKKFGEVIKNIFSKKDKKEEPKNNEVVLEEPKPATNRQATKRESDTNSSDNNPISNEISNANLMNQVDLSSNAPDNWMMGVKNLKITLHNRSNVTIQAAAVTVNYYDENNGLLEKKLVYFNNVASKGKATVNAPDHKFADHVDFKLTSVSAKEDRYARF